MGFWKEILKAVDDALPTPASPPARRAKAPAAPREPKEVKLLAPNVPEDWADPKVHLEWDWPVSVVAGESHHHDALVSLTGPPIEGGYSLPVPVELILEPTNPYDPNAVRVEVRGLLVGYINGKDAPAVTARLKAVSVDRITLAGMLKGGDVGLKFVGVMIWPTKRISPAPSLSFRGARRVSAQGR